VLPTSEGDVINAVKISNKHKAKVTVMGGGHSAVSSSDLAILISMKVPAMQSINFEPLYNRVTVGPGVTMGMINEATNMAGHIVPVGV